MTRRARPDRHDEPGHLVVVRAFRVAAAEGTPCRPRHLLAALAERDGVIGDVLRPLRPPPPDPAAPGRGTHSSYVFGQLQGAAGAFASRRGEPMDAPHLLVALLDQGDAEAMGVLADAGIDPADVRRAALAELGAPPELPPIAIPGLTPAGTLDRPALAVDQLDQRAWTVLAWRQDHLPLDRVRRMGQAEAR